MGWREVHYESNRKWEALREYSIRHGDFNVKTYAVYRVDYIRETREPVGKLIERRRMERENNTEALLRLAQRLYSTSSLDSHIVINPE